MKILVYFIFFLFFVVSPVFGGETYGDINHSQYISALSGNIFVANIPGQHPLIGRKIEITLKGIEVPDFYSSCQYERNLANKSKEMLGFLLARAKLITLKNVERGSRFRIVATVLADGKDIREVLLKKGLAVKSKDGAKSYDWCGKNTKKYQGVKK